MLFRRFSTAFPVSKNPREISISELFNSRPIAEVSSLQTINLTKLPVSSKKKNNSRVVQIMREKYRYTL